MRKSVFVLSIAAGLLLASSVTVMLAAVGTAGLLMFSSLALATGLAVAMVAAGRLVMARQARLESGERDLFLALNASRSESSVLAGAVPAWGLARRSLAQHVFGHPLLVGDIVRIRSLEAIRATLDEHSCLEGLPFMQEMEAFCGRTARVYRVVDKVYDYGRSRLMRRLDRCVLLVGLRCDGSDHGDCEAACYLIWKAAWLEFVPCEEPMAITEAEVKPAPPTEPIDGQIYRCQYTELTASSRPQPSLSIHALLGPLVVGNVNSGAFAVAILSRIFNAFQTRRGGVGFPAMPTAGSDRSIKGETLNPGDWVRVKTSAEIARTLDKNSKNKGLWFDRDMLKFCGQTFQVRGRVQQIVDITSLAMIPMKSPCIMLETVHFTGEFQGFGEQHDYLYWREVWLQPVRAPESPV